MLKHKVVVGLGFGDEGKGTIVDALCARDRYNYVVRFSGGPQAAHNVVLDDGTHHTFAQFGAGTFSDTPTILSRFMMVNPFNLAQEADALWEKLGEDPYKYLRVSENSLLITPWHVALNQLEEIRRGWDRHGSCGEGIGIAQKFALDYPDLAFRVKDLLLDRDSFVAKAMMVKELLKAEYGGPSKEEISLMDQQVLLGLGRTPGNLQGMYRMFLGDSNLMIVTDEEIKNMISSGPCVFEGSQGALLDEWKGFHPYTTWSTTTPENALTLLEEAGVNREDVEVIGTTRTYHTRHGAGPFPSELTDGRAYRLHKRETHNTYGVFQGHWRVGDLDLRLLEYAAKIVGRIDGVAVTHMDIDAVDTVVSYDLSLNFDEFDTAYENSHDLDVQEKLTGYLESLDQGDFFFTVADNTATVLESIEIVTGAPVIITSHGAERGKKVFRGTGPLEGRYRQDNVRIN